MSELGDGREVVRYVSNPAWWTPVLLVLVLLPSQIRSGGIASFFLDLAIVVVLLTVLYVITHPTLTFSANEVAQRRGPFRVTINLNHLQSVRANTVNRRTNVLDPNTGDRRSVIRWRVKSPDDWGGRPPVQGFYLRDANDSHLALGVVRTSVDRWGAFLLHAIKDQPEVQLGPRVIDALEAFTR